MKRSTQSHSSDVRIVLLGRNEAEISAVGNMIVKRKAFKESRREVCEVQRGRVEERNISVIDTPGFINAEVTDEDLQNEMMKSLSLSHPGPHVFLLIVRPDTFTEDDVRNIIQKIEETFGAHVLKFTLVLFIRETMTNKEWMALTISKKYQDLISHFKGKYHVMNSHNDVTEITTLLEKIDKIIKQNADQHYVKFSPIKKWPQKEKVQVPQTESDQKFTSISRVTSSVTRQHDDKDLRIVLLGTSGNGKSTTGNTIMGSDLFKVEMSSESVTTLSETHQKMVDGRNIRVTDTPGLFDTSMTEEHLNSEIVKCILMSAPGPHVFLLIIRLDVKFRKELKNTVRWIQGIFSEDALNYVMILFTRGDQLDKSIEDFLKKNKQLKDLVDKCKGGCHVFNNKDKNQAQVTELLKKIDRLLMENRGQHYTNDLYQEAQRKITEGQKRQTVEQRRHEEELRNREEELRNREEELRNREEQLRNREEERKMKEEQEIQKKIDVELKINKLVRNMSVSRRTPVDRVAIITALLAASVAVRPETSQRLSSDQDKYSIVQKTKTENTTTFI